MSTCCGSKKGTRTVLLYACSGGANVAEIADRAADSEVARAVAKAKEVLAQP